MSDEFNPALMGAEVTDLETGSLQSIGDAVRYGIPSTLVSGALGIYNTGLDYLGKDQVNIQDTITKYDQLAGNYYEDHKQAVDLAGGIAASLIPGSIGIKALQLARAGQALGSVGKVLNIAASNKEKYLRAALQEVGSTAGIVPKLASANRLKYVAYEAADQALMGLAAEAAVVVAMHDAPMFSTDTYSDFATNMALGAVTGGVVGGAIGSFMAKGFLRTAAEEVSARTRAIDVINQGDSLGLSRGNQTLQLAEQIAFLPEVANTVPIKYKIDGVTRDLNLQTEAALQTAKDRAVQTAEGKLRTSFTSLAEDDAAVGQAYYDLIQRGMEAAGAAGKVGADAIEIAHGYLQNVAKIGSIDLNRYALDATKFYIDSKPAGNTAWERLKNTFTPKRSETTSKQAYRLADDAAVDSVVTKDFDELGAKNLKEAFKANPNVDMIRLPDGRLTVNPLSETVKRVGDTPYVVRKYTHLETGTITDRTVPTIADIGATKDFRWTVDGVSVGASKTFKQPASIATAAIADPLAASARWAWASKLEAAQLLKLSGGVIDSADLPLVSRLAELNTDLTKFSIKEGTDLLPAHEFLSLKEAAIGYRRDVLRELADSKNPATASTQHHAAYLNTSLDFVESLIGSNYKLAGLSEDIIAAVPETASALTPKNVMVEWNFGSVKSMLPERAYEINMGPSHLATKELTKEYQMLIRQDIGMKAQMVTLGSDMDNFMPAPSVRNSGVTAEGAGATLGGASNADYTQRAKLWVQDTGKAVALTTQRWRDAAIEMLAPAVNGIRTDLRASAELGSITTALRKSTLRFSLVADDVTGERFLVSRQAKKIMATPEAQAGSWADAASMAADADGLVHSFPVSSQPVIDFLEGIVKQNDGRVNKFTTLHNAAGVNTKYGFPGEIYVPPVNTQKYPFVAMVQTKRKVGLGTDTTMITAKSEDQLRAYAAELSNDYNVYFKGDTAEYHRAMGDYQYSMTINENTINSDLMRRGKLADAIPETRPENVLTDWLEWTAKQEEKLVRTAVQVGNRQFFSEMQFLSENYRMAPESQARGIGAALKSKIQDPFGDYIKTALNISKQGEFPLLDSLNEFIDKIGYTAGNAIAKAQSQAAAGTLDWQEAQKVMNKYGLGQGLTVENYKIANEIYPSNVIRDVLAKGNMWLANTTLRFDFINPLINMISTPIMIGTEVSALRRIIGGDSQLAKDFEAVMKVAGPGGREMPSTTALIAKSINNFFGKDKTTLIQRYKDIGAIKEISQLYHDTLDSLSFKSTVNPGKYAAKIDAAVEAGSRLTGNTFTEDFTRFVSADVMRQISEPLIAGGKLTTKEQNAFISTFVNRVQGNYVTSQRPVVFQGTTGAAVSLFQTYAFNVLQQLTRHIENGDKRTLMIFGGLQSSMFGLNGLPFFDAINTHLVGSWLANNPQHNDAYNILPKFNKELGDWALYGSASAFPLFGDKAPALYTRGDINPRHITILPTSFADIPVVAASVKAWDTISGLGKSVTGGADMSESMLRALEHQGWNRPLAGLAQVLNGQSTTSKGALVSAASEFDTTAKLASMQSRLVDFGGVPRMLGARPMNEAIALNNLYRNKAYEALDKERIDRLGQVVKTKLAGNTAPSEEDINDFMLRYTRSGGRIENFSASMQRWSKDANVSIINETMRHVGSSSGMKLQAIMGGEGLDDRMTIPQIASQE